MSGIMSLWERLTGVLSSKFVESVALLFVRLALAFPFWTSGRTKVVDGTLLEIDESQYFIFDEVFSGLPLSSSVAVPMTVYAEFFLPILIVLGLFTRFAALALFIMTMVIQIFVFPEAWWTVHIFWAALAAVLLSRGAGMLSIDKVISMVTGSKAA